MYVFIYSVTVLRVVLTVRERRHAVGQEMSSVSTSCLTMQPSSLSKAIRRQPIGFENAWEITLELTQTDLRNWPQLSTNNSQKHAHTYIFSCNVRLQTAIYNIPSLTHCFKLHEQLKWMSQHIVFSNWSPLDSPATSPISKRTNNDRRINMPQLPLYKITTGCWTHLKLSITCLIFVESSLYKWEKT